MKLNKCLLITWVIALSTYVQTSYAQQDAMFTQYMFNTLAINPAYAGSNEVITATGLFRRQWVNIDGAPTTGTFSIDAPLLNEKVGVGLNIVADQIGITSTVGVFASYAYRIKLNERGRLAMGLQAGFSQYSADLANASLDQAGTVDPAFESNISELMPNVGVGLWYNDDRLYAGISAPHLLNNSLSSDYQFLSSTDGARQFRHYFALVGYIFDLTTDIKLRPSVLFKAVEGAPMQFDFNGTVWFYEKVGVGLSYRTSDSIDALLEFQLTPQFRLGYAYDYTLTDLQDYNSGSHELMLRYQFSFKRSKIITPRFF
ncbi:MAG: type IX secretion system membrane protein PorP/SprF [Thermonemataceae bacterium]